MAKRDIVVIGASAGGIEALLELVPRLPADLIQRTLSDHGKTQELIVAATNRRGKRIQCRVAISPVVGSDQQGVRGVILMMEDITP